MSYTGIPVTEQIKFKGKGPLDEKSFIESISELSEIDEKYITVGMIITCTANAGHYIYLPNATDITTSPVVDKWYLLEQVEYDNLCKIGSLKLCLSVNDIPQPLSPAVCKWEEVSDYDDMILYPSSADTIGTAIEQQSTTEAHTLTALEIPSHQHYISLPSKYGGGYVTNQVAFGTNDTTVTTLGAYTSYTGGGQGHTHDIESGAKLDGVTIKIYRRTE